MRKLTVFVLLMSVLLTGVSALAQDPIFLTTRASLNVRSLPSVDAPSLQVAPQGTTILAIGRNAATTWTQVEFKGVIGWVSNAYVGASGDLNSLPITDATDPSVNPRPQEQVSAPDGTIVQAGTIVVFANQSFVNVRALPDESSEVLRQLVPSQRATVTVLDPTRTWGRVEVDGSEGWVALYAVNVLGDIRTVEILGRPDTGANLPLPDDTSLADREVVDRLQAHLARWLPKASTLIDVLSRAVDTGLLACNTRDVPLIRPYRPTIADVARVPEIEAIVADMNIAFDLLNDARVPWVAACYGGNTQQYRGQFPSWLQTARDGANLLANVQQRIAVLGAD
jgi:uncharacterized protein YraI